MRWRLVVLALATVGVGLATRRVPDIFPRLVATYGGDALWATLGQLFTAPWLVALRAHPLGALVLGRGFVWSDLACYTAGIALAWRMDVRGIALTAADRVAAFDD